MGVVLMTWRKAWLWALMLVAVLSAGDEKQGGAGIALAILIAAHLVAKRGGQ